MKLYYDQSGVKLYHGHVLDVLRSLPDESVNCCVTSPPYWGLRDYGTAEWSGGSADCDHVYNHGTQGSTGDRANRTFTGQAMYKGTCGKCGAARVDQQIGLEATPEEFVAKMVEVFREVRRVLRSDGTCWVNLGDSYATGAGKVGSRPGGDEVNNYDVDGATRRTFRYQHCLCIPDSSRRNMAACIWRIDAGRPKQPLKTYMTMFSSCCRSRQFHQHRCYSKYCKDHGFRELRQPPLRSAS